MFAALHSKIMASDRVEVDTARPFRSVKEAVAVFGERILVGGGESNSRYSSSAVVAVANPRAIDANATVNAKHEDSSRSSAATLSPNAMAEVDAEEPEPEATAAIVPMYSAHSSPSFTSPRSAYEDDGGHGGCHCHDDDEAGLAIVASIRKMEAEVADTRREVVQLRKRGAEMEMAVASLNAQLHRGLSRLAEIEADKAAAAARRSVGGDTDAMVRSERWAEKSSTYNSEYLPSFSHALSLGELDDDDDDGLLGGGGGGRRTRKAQKVKPIVPLIGDILFSKSFSKRKSGKGSGDLSIVLG